MAAGCPDEDHHSFPFSPFEAAPMLCAPDVAEPRRLISRRLSMLKNITLATSIAVFTATTAFAHVTVETKEAPVGTTYKAVLRVPHGCDGKATNVLRIRIPEGFFGVKAQPKAGWTLEKIKGSYARSYDNHGTAVSEGVKEVVWSGGNLGDDEYDEFVVRGTIAGDLAAGSTLYFPVVQECGEGLKERWIEIPAEGQKGSDLEMPAPGVKLLQKVTNYRTEPADGAVIRVAPGVIRLFFSEPVAPTALSLIGPDGRAIPLDRFVLRDKMVEIAPPPGLSSGTHVLSWRVVSEDGHPVGGSSVFSIGRASAPVQPAAASAGWPVAFGLWLGKTAMYIGVFFGIGGAFSARWIADGSRAAFRPTSLALGIGGLGLLLSLGVQGLDATGETIAHFLRPSVWGAAFDTTFGTTGVLMGAAFALAGLSLAQEPGTGGRMISLAGLLAAATALSLSGHASSADPQWVMRPAVFLHVMTVAVWVGSLLPLYMAFSRREAGAAQALGRFSVLIPFAVLPLLLAGIVLAVVQLGSAEALVASAYGIIFLIKLGLVVLLLTLASVNRWSLTARSRQGEPTAIRLLLRSIAAETAILLLVLGLAAGWRFTPPPRSATVAAVAYRPVHLEKERIAADLSIAGGRDGQWTLSAQLNRTDGSQLEVQEVILTLWSPQSGVEPIRRKLDRSGALWEARAVRLPQPPSWTLRLDVVINDFEISRLDGETRLTD
eukprot:g29507.t1